MGETAARLRVEARDSIHRTQTPGAPAGPLTVLLEFDRYFGYAGAGHLLA
jgi:hypothetical protein